MQLRKRLASAPQPTTAAAQTRPAGDEQQTEEPQPTAETATGPAVSTVHFTPVSVHIQSKSRGSSQTNAVDQIMEALVASSERHNQLINLSESLLRSQQVQAGQSRYRHQFNMWCGTLMQEMPQDLYEACEAEMFRLMTHYRNLSRQRQTGK